MKNGEQAGLVLGGDLGHTGPWLTVVSAATFTVHTQVFAHKGLASAGEQSGVRLNQMMVLDARRDAEHSELYGRRGRHGYWMSRTIENVLPSIQASMTRNKVMASVAVYSSTSSSASKVMSTPAVGLSASQDSSSR